MTPLSNGGPPLVDDDVKRMEFVLFHIKDFLQGVRGMKFADVGAYILVLMHLYDMMGDLPDDDRWMSIHLGVDIRTWKTAKARLLELKKIEIRGGRIWNRRVEEEITEYVKKVRAKQAESEAAKKREAEKRAKREAEEAAAKEAAEADARKPSAQRSTAICAGSPASPPGVLPDSPRISQQVLSWNGGDLSEKANDFNGGTAKTGPGGGAGNEQISPLDKKIEDKKEKTLTPPPPSLPHLDLAPGEERVGGRVVVNCETVRHPGFTLSLPAITMQLVLANVGLSKREAEPIARDAAIAHALQWGAEIDAGRSPQVVVPSNPANFIRGSVAAQMRKGGLPAKQVGTLSTKGLSPEQAARVEAAVKRAREGGHV